MKIKSIEQDKNDSHIYVVTFEPNWFEKLFRIIETTKKYKDNGLIYMFGSGNVYINQSGKELGNGNYIGKAIDNWRRKW